jgi:hypothetical protein
MTTGGTEFSKTPKRSPCRLRTDFFEEIGGLLDPHRMI